MPDATPDNPNVQDDAADTMLLDELRMVVDRRTTQQTSDKTSTDRLEGIRIGSYLITRLLGEGGMAQVYRATDETLGREVALKVLKHEYRTDHSLCVRLEREARSMARIRHENVVHIIDFPRSETLSAIAMELLPGGSLRKRLSQTLGRQETLSIPDAVRWAIQAARGIGAAHELGLVHRDIKPSNLLLDQHDNIKVADFGTILLLEQTTWLTGVGQRIGTPGYMSPEQCRAERVTPASDIYSLGITIFELLTGQLPYVVEEASPFAMMLKHISEPPEDPRRLRPDMPEWLARMVLKCLSKSPADRYATGSELAKALSGGESAAPARHEGENRKKSSPINTTAVRQQLQQLPQRAIVLWACRCARRVQPLNPDPRAIRALDMAESSVTAGEDGQSPRSLAGALSRISTLRLASIQAASPNAGNPAAADAAKAAAAAAASATARCIDDAAADAAFAARSAVSAIKLSGKSVKEFWNAARQDYLKLLGAGFGEAGTIGRAIPSNFFQ